MKGILTILLFSICTITVGWSQFNIPSKDIVQNAPHWAQLMYSENPNVFEVERAFRSHYKGKTIKKNLHTRNLKFFRRTFRYRVGKDGFIAPVSDRKYQDRIAKAKEKLNSRNAAGNWSLIGPIQSLTEAGDPGADQACVYSIDQSLSNPSILFCGTEPGEIYKSTDGGENWVNMSLGLTLPFEGSGIRSVAIDPTNSNTVYFGMRNEIFKSTDGGVNWNSIHNIPPSTDEVGMIEKIFIHPNQNNIIMVASMAGLVRSTDGGATWTTLFDDRTYDIEMNTADDNTIYALRRNANTEIPEFLMSDDYGATFSIQSNGWYNSTNPNRESDGGRIAVTEADANRVYAYLIGQSKPGDYGYIGVYRSDDGGTTWTLPSGQVGSPYDENHFNINSADGEGENSDNIFADISFCALTASHNDPDKILLGGLNLWKSDDGGVTFQPLGGYIDAPFNDAIHDGSFHVDMQEFKTIGNTTWITTDGGIYKSNNFFSDISFEKKNKGVHSTDFWGFGSGWNKDVLVGGVYHNGVLAYNENFGDGEYMVLGGGEPSSGYVNPGENNLIYSTDVAGVILPDVIGPVEEFAYDFIPNESFDPLQEGYSDLVFHPECYSVAFTGKLNELWRTIDKGLSFQKIRTFGNVEENFVSYIHISRINPDIMYLCQREEAVNKAKLWFSSDAGETWNEVSIPSDLSKFMILQVHPYDPSRIYLASSDFNDPVVIYQSNDAGESWSNIATPTLGNEYMKTLDFIPGTNGGLYLGTNLGMYYKNDNMTDWMDFSDGLPAVSTAQKSKPFYRDNKLRISSTKGMWESVLFERPDQPFAQIMVDRIETCAEVGSTFTFVDYSILKHSGAQWEWTFEGATPATGSTWMEQVTFNTAGTHQVILKITDDRGFTSSDTIEINIGGTAPSMDILFDQEACTSVSNSDIGSESSQLTVLPNPTKDRVRISFETDKSGEYSVRVFSTSGKMLSIKELPAASNNLVQYDLDMGHLPKGTYWIQVKGEEEMIFEKVVLF